MRITTTLFLLLAMSLPLFAYHDRDDRDHHPRRHRRVVVEDCGPRVYVHRRHLNPYAYPPPGRVHHPRRWRESRHRSVYFPPPPLVVRPHASIWIGF